MSLDRLMIADDNIQAEIDKICFQMSVGNKPLQLTYKYDYVDWMTNLAIFSSFFNGSLALFVWSNKRLQVHPMQLMMIMQLTESLMIHWYYTVMKVCPWHLDTFYAKTVLLACKDEQECQL